MAPGPSRPAPSCEPASPRHAPDPCPIRARCAITIALTCAALAPLAVYRVVELVALAVPAGRWWQALATVLPALAMLCVSAVVWRRIAPFPGRTRPRGGENYALAVAAGLLLGSLAAAANLLTMLAGEDAPAAALDPGPVALVLHIVVLAPLAEEVAFRGLLYRHLRQLAAPCWATFASALVFALMHASLAQGFFAFLLGLLAAFAYEQTRSLLTPMLIHGLFNAVPVGVAVVRTYPDDFSPLWLVLALIALAFAFAARHADLSSAADRPRPA